jgi:hypothetical protein
MACRSRIPLGRHGIVDVVAVRPGVVAEVALIGAVVDPALLGALRHVVLDRQVVDVDLAANAVLAGVVDHHVLDDLDAARVGRVDQVLIGGVRRFQPGIDAGPVVGVVAVVVEAAAVLDRRGDPDGGEAEIADVVEPLDQPLKSPRQCGSSGWPVCD